MKNLSNETKTQTAIQMVIMDAIEKGHTNANELIEYMKSEVFEKAVKNSDVQDDLRTAFEGDFPLIKTVGDNKHLNITTSYKKGIDSYKKNLCKSCYK